MKTKTSKRKLAKCRYSKCKTPFYPKTGHQRYHCDACKAADRKTK